MDYLIYAFEQIDRNKGSKNFFLLHKLSKMLFLV